MYSFVFDKALKCGTDRTAARIELSALPVRYLKCMRDPLVARNNGTYPKVLDIIAKEGITHLAEYRQSMDSLRKFVEEAK